MKSAYAGGQSKNFLSKVFERGAGRTFYPKSFPRVSFINFLFPLFFLFENVIEGAEGGVAALGDLAFFDGLDDGAALLFGVATLGVAAIPVFKIGQKLAKSVGQVVF